eukprot:6059237-Amphidinium_carterae.2
MKAWSACLHTGIFILSPDSARCRKSTVGASWANPHPQCVHGSCDLRRSAASSFPAKPTMPWAPRQTLGCQSQLPQNSIKAQR